MERHDKGVRLGMTDISGTILLTSRCASQERLFDQVKIVLVGKYTDLKDSYMSVIKALEHSAFRVRRELGIQARSAFSVCITVC